MYGKSTTQLVTKCLLSLLVFIRHVLHYVMSHRRNLEAKHENTKSCCHKKYCYQVDKYISNDKLAVSDTEFLHRIVTFHRRNEFSWAKVPQSKNNSNKSLMFNTLVKTNSLCAVYYYPNTLLCLENFQFQCTIKLTYKLFSDTSCCVTIVQIFLFS